MASSSSPTTTWQAVVSKKRDIRSNLVEPFPINECSDASITKDDDVRVLAERVANGELRAHDVALAYIKK